ncbi:MAG: hypothetical protein IKW59_01800 [Clostridia bacterium]|nr:hypothetical protein [Clostridia bacterium]
MDDNTWEMVEDILFDGTSDEIRRIACPDCGEKVFYNYNADSNSLEYGCKNCGKTIRAHGCHQIPNCSNY